MGKLAAHKTPYNTMNRLQFFKTLFLGALAKKKPEEENKTVFHLKGSDLHLLLKRRNLNLRK